MRPHPAVGPAEQHFNIALSMSCSLGRDLDEDFDVEQWWVTLDGRVIDDVDTVDKFEVGHARFIVHREADYANWYDELDSIDADSELVASALADPRGSVKHSHFVEFGIASGTVAVIDMVHVEPRFRGWKLSHALVDHAADVIAHDGLLALCPWPTEGASGPGQVSAVRQHWRGAGFRLVRRGVYARAAWPPRR